MERLAKEIEARREAKLQAEREFEAAAAERETGRQVGRQPFEAEARARRRARGRRLAAHTRRRAHPTVPRAPRRHRSHDQRAHCAAHGHTTDKRGHRTRRDLHARLHPFCIHRRCSSLHRAIGSNIIPHRAGASARIHHSTAIWSLCLEPSSSERSPRRASEPRGHRRARAHPTIRPSNPPIVRTAHFSAAQCFLIHG